MNGGDVRFLEVVDGRVQALPGLGGRRGSRASALELFAQSQLQLTSGLFAERDGDNLADCGPLMLDQRDNAADQLGGLAGAGRGLDDQRLVELAGDRLPVLSPRLRSGQTNGTPARGGLVAPHGSFLSASRSLNSFASLRRVRCSSPRPHTTLK